MKRSIGFLITTMLFVVGFAFFLRGEEPGAPHKGGKGGGGLYKPDGTPLSTMLNINKVAAWYNANGEQERIPSTGNSGLYYPRGTSTAVYSAGLVWSGQFQDGRSQIIRTNGQSYNNGTKPGAILGIRTGVAEDPNAPDVRIWRIRRDYATADLKQDAAEINSKAINNVTDGDIQAIRDQYLRDWAEWPWRKGAPFYDTGYVDINNRLVGKTNGILDWGEDVNHNGVLNPGEDVNNNGKLDGEPPGLADADQVIWYVCNDIGVAQPWTCLETGMEEQTTIWGYARTDALGNVIFKKFRLIYKGTAITPPTARVDSMYMCQWSDIDLGDSGDDFAGCDTNLSLGYVYNGKVVDINYADFGLKPPASGYDFLQGPLKRGVAGQDLNKNGIDDAQDFAIFNLNRVGPGYINLPMTTFIYFAAGGTYSDPPFNLSGATEWNQMLRGLPPTPVGPPDPPALRFPVTVGPYTSYWLSGDPVKGTGWRDGGKPPGQVPFTDNPGDRRILLSSGPFTLALGDTQELVSAWVGGLGSSAVGSVSVMKFNDRSAQLAYNNLFSLPKAPSSPNVRIIPLDQEVLIDWEFDSSSVAKTEVPVLFGGYQFEGYNLYQLPSASADLASGKKLATYDLVNGVTSIFQDSFDPNTGEVLSLPVELGTDAGIKRFISITRDEFRGRPLVNGQRYYFAVTAYNYLPSNIDPSNPVRTLESAPQTISVVPEKSRPGSKYSYAIGDTIKGVSNVVGVNDAVIRPVVFNPTQQTGQSYQMRFDTLAGGAKVWTLSNTTSGKTLLSNVTDFSGTTEFRIADGGFSLYVSGPPSGVRSVQDASGKNVFGTGALSSTSYAVLSRTDTLSAIAGPGSRTNVNYEIRFDGNTTPSFALSFVPLRSVRVPFSVWETGRTASDAARRVIPGIRDSGTVDRWALTPKGILIRGARYKVFEQIFVTALSYPASNDSAALVTAPLSTTIFQTCTGTQAVINLALKDVFIAPANGDSVTAAPQGTVIKLNKFLEIRAGDVKAIAPVALTVGSVALAKSEVQNIKVFPNPYYGLNRAETDRVVRFITFSHLPAYAKVRIINLAGVLVRTLEKSDPTQFLRWDLQNDSGLPVASGIYIAYIELKDANGTDLGIKTVKFAIIQEQQFLRFF